MAEREARTIAKGAAPVVETVYGPVRGIRENGVAVFRAVPYAAPVRGSARFAPPKPPAKWTAVRSATEHGPMCPQPAGMPIEASLRTGEDHRTVTVHTPAIDDRLRPVMVWLHGGAYLMGAGSQAVYDGTALARGADVVVVTVNHRLGVLGFMDLSSLSTPDAEFTANTGLRDQIAALEWVRENIAAFGGDPGSVTVFGESSGAGAITTLMTVPAAEGLFHRAIAQSPPATSVYGRTRAARVAHRLLDRLGLMPEEAGRLHRLPIGKVVLAASEIIGETFAAAPGTLAAAPTVDRDLVPHYPVAAFTKGRQHKIPLIIGTTANEAALFRWIRGPFLPTTVEEVVRMLTGLTADNPEVDPDRIGAIIAGYPDLIRRGGALRMSGDAAFRMPAVWIAEAHSRHAPTWLYRFDHAAPALRLSGVGATHATDVPYVFGTFGATPKDPSFALGGLRRARKVSARIQARWTGFARTGRPDGVEGLIDWPTYDRQRASLLIGRRDTVAEDIDGRLRRLWGERPIGFR